MKSLFFPKLAVNGIRKNRQIYIPYLITCIMMVALYFILDSLIASPVVNSLQKGVDKVMFSLWLGRIVIVVFSAIFLLYSSSFLTRRRNKEFGLYNILGMDKRNIRRIVLFESFLTAVMGIVGGIIVGAVLTKLSEIGFAYIIRVEPDYALHISLRSILTTVAWFAAIFALLTIRSVVTIQMNNALELFHSENPGEKAPKANWLLSLIGLIILGGAYWIAISITSPLSALLLFFVAVIMVIIGTYILFVTGSVAICKLLKSNKSYYYKKNHFVSVASMIFRMKRNGAGLASICILCTMVLVMVSSTTSLYFGQNRSIKDRYLADIQYSFDISARGRVSDEETAFIEKAYTEFVNRNGYDVTEKVSMEYALASGRLNGSVLETSPEVLGGWAPGIAEQLANFVFVGEDDYNRIMGTDIHVEPGHYYANIEDLKTSLKTLTIGDVTWHKSGSLKKKLPCIENSGEPIPCVFLVISNLDEVSGLLDVKTDRERYTYRDVNVKYMFGFSTNANEDGTVKLFKTIWKDLFTEDFQSIFGDGENWFSYRDGCGAVDKNEFLEMWGSLFFLGIILSIAFTMATVLIIYYKQITEGFEDRPRFEIMQKVGMTKKDIKKSINSQILTVFYAPLFFAGLHLLFAFPLIWKILKMFMITDFLFVTIVTIVTFILFTVIYAMIYKFTAGTYYNLVSED